MIRAGFNGKLFFETSSSGSILCECIGDPYGQDIAEEIEKMRSHLMNARNILEADGYFYAKEIDRYLVVRK